ncbi:oligosaccharide flippase family protein [uncultured Hymenobacter sp.]|uniref:oligosaccharide flippase family protein n=1 Tax=uncultured Hymenobacter sp. TaxID=170016 RepID=UPI0035CB88D3
MQRPAPGLSRFFGSISLAVLLNLLVKPGWVVLENLVQDRLGHAAFGLLAALSSLTVVALALADLGLTQSGIQRTAAEPDFFTEHFPTLHALRGLLNVVALAALLALGWALGYRGAQLGLLAGIGGALLLTQYGLFLRGVFQGRQHFRTDAVLSVLEKLVLLGAVLALVAVPGALRLPSYVGARVAAAAFTIVLLYGLLRRFFGPVRARLSRPASRALLRQSLPFALITVLYGLNERIDMVMLERLASPREAGYYAGAYRWMDAAMMYAWTVLPLFFARFAGARPAELRQLLGLGQRVLAVPLLFVVAFVLFRGEVVFWQFSHSSGAEVARMSSCLKILFLNVLVHAFFAIYSTLLTSTGYARAVSTVVAGSVLLNIGLNLWLMPRYGALAAAWNTLVCVGFVSAGYVWLLARRTAIPVPGRVLARLLLAFGLLCGAWYVLRQGVYLSWYIETGLMAAVFGLIVLGTGLIRQSELKQLTMSNER